MDQPEVAGHTLLTSAQWIARVTLLGCLLLIGTAIAQTQRIAQLGEADALFAEVLRIWPSGPSAQVESMLQRVLTIREAVLGPRDRSVAQVRDQIGRLHYNRRQFDQAERFFREAVDIAEVAIGGQDLITATYLGDLGASLRELGRYPDAEAIVQRSLAIRRAQLPADDTAIAGSLNNIGRTYLAQRRGKDAAVAFEEALGIYEKRFGAQEPVAKELAQQLALARRLEQNPDAGFRVTWTWSLPVEFDGCLRYLAALVACIAIAFAAWRAKFWASSTPLEFESAFGLSEAIERLRAATRRSVFSALAREEAVGTVTETRVSLQRAIPMVGNSFKPFYRGRFVERDGKAILVGRFAMHWLAKMFMAFWFVMIGAITLSAIVLTDSGQQAALSALFGSGMMVAGTALVSTGTWFARNDATWLSGVIRGALSAQAVVEPSLADVGASGVRSPTRPLALTIAAGVLTLGAVMSLVGTVVEIYSAQTGPSVLDVTSFYGAHSPYLSAFLGIFMLALGVGVYRRRLLAWRAGFGLLAGSLIYSVASLLAMRADLVVTIGFWIGFLVVTGLWGIWWHAQRVHFQD